MLKRNRSVLMEKKTVLKEKEPVLISGCLLGLCCRYDGKSKPAEKAAALQKNADFLIISNNNIAINKDYFYISNAIISDLI